MDLINELGARFAEERGAFKLLVSSKPVRFALKCFLIYFLSRFVDSHRLSTRSSPFSVPTTVDVVNSPIASRNSES